MSSLIDIKVIGCGGGGVNAVDGMINAGLSGVEFIAINTDAQALMPSLADVKVDIGRDRTNGLGAGANPEIGRLSAKDSVNEINEVVSGADVVFVTAGMGGGTGTGSAPIVANCAKKAGALTVGVVTTPFAFEGSKRMTNALEGINNFSKEVDTLIVVPNENLISMLDPEISMEDAFKEADGVLLKAVAAISDLVTTPGQINIDFADIKRVMKDAGSAFMGIGYADGENRAEIAGNEAITSPILDVDLNGATGVLISIASSGQIKLQEVNKIASLVSDKAHKNADIIFGTLLDQDLEDGILVTVIATGFKKEINE
jgi:cell division protein FtsZ